MITELRESSETLVLTSDPKRVSTPHPESVKDSRYQREEGQEEKDGVHPGHGHDQHQKHAKLFERFNSRSRHGQPRQESRQRHHRYRHADPPQHL